MTRRTSVLSAKILDNQCTRAGFLCSARRLWGGPPGPRLAPRPASVAAKPLCGAGNHARSRLSAGQPARTKACGHILLCTLFALTAINATAEPPLQRTSGNYLVTLRPPADGIFAREEAQIEFHIEDTSRPDPLTGNTPVIRAHVEVTIDMPSMSGMPPFRETAHAEDVPGDYGVHPVLAHGGDYLMHVAAEPPGAPAFKVDFPIAVQDATDALKRKRQPPRFLLDLTTTPKTPKPGEPVDLRLIIRDRETPKTAITEFDRAHDEVMHLVIVRDDLTGFAHEHPVLGTDGTFTLRYQFPKAGEYRLFADVAPKNAGAQVLPARIKVAGKVTRAPFEPRPALQEIDGMHIQLKTVIVPVKRTTEICFTVDPATGLQPYLGARAHLISIHEDASTYVHAHADESTPAAAGALNFNARFPQPGHYHGWIQFRRDGRLITADFTIEAK